MTAQDVAHRFDAKRTGNSWSAKCPSHDDNVASLSISQGEKGVVVYCHVCGKGATAEILSMVNLKMTDMFDTEAANVSKVGPIIADYRYIGLDGQPVLRVTRHTPKTFRQWRPDGGGGWIAGVEGVQKVLYHLPELKGCDAVFVVEGEKDVDELTGRSIPATCNVGGASVWSVNYVNQMKEVGIKRVIVIPDNDAAGRKHAQEVADTCLDAGLKVKVLTLPGLDDKGDVSDWFTQGNVKDDLYALVKATEEYKKPLKSYTETITIVERSLIGAVLLNNDSITSNSAEEFSDSLHRMIWQGLRDVYDRDGAVVVSSLVHYLNDRWFKNFPTTEPVTYLTLCMDSIGTAGTNDVTKSLANQVRTFWRAATAKRIGAELVASGLTADQAMAKLDELPGPMTGAIYDPADNWLSIREEWVTKKSLKTGFWQLDDMTQGFTPGEVVVIAGRTSQGKTAFAKSLQRRLSKNHVSTEYITLEETANSITRRHIAEGSGVATYKIKSGPPLLTPEDFVQCDEEVIKLQELGFTVTALDTISSLDEDTVLGCVANSEARVVFLDHIQKVNTRGESRAYGIERVVNRLHGIGIKQKKCIVIMWQFNREMDKEGRRPLMADMRDSGVAEIVPRQVWLLCWPTKLNLPAQEHDVIAYDAYEVHVAKNSDGGQGTIHLIFDPMCGAFSDAMPNMTQSVKDFTQSASEAF